MTSLHCSLMSRHKVRQCAVNGVKFKCCNSCTGVRACVTLNIELAEEGAGISNGTPASGAGEPSAAAARPPSKCVKKNKKKKVTLHIVRYNTPQHLPALSKTSPVLCIGSFMRLPAACFRHIAQQRTGNVHQIGGLL